VVLDWGEHVLDRIEGESRVFGGYREKIQGAKNLIKDEWKEENR